MKPKWKKNDAPSKKVEIHTAASIYPRCPSWSPGNELKCIGAKGHEGACHAVRINGIDKGAKAIWDFRLLPEDRDRMEAEALGKEAREELEREKMEALEKQGFGVEDVDLVVDHPQ